MTSVQENRLEVRRKMMIFYLDASGCVSVLSIFPFLEKGTPSETIKHAYDPSYCKYQGADLE